MGLGLGLGLGLASTLTLMFASSEPVISLLPLLVRPRDRREIGER